MHTCAVECYEGTFKTLVRKANQRLVLCVPGLLLALFPGFLLKNSIPGINYCNVQLLNQPVVADIEEILYNPGTSRTEKSVCFTE